jgi:branched-chain amino acid transport system substrate-binding protein
MSLLRAALVTPLSGPLSAYGRAGAEALRLWADWYAGRAELLVFDAHPDPAAAVRQAERDRPELLFGPYGSGPTVAAAAATSRLLWNHGGARVGPADHLISVLAPASTYFHGAVNVVHDADPEARRVAVLHADSRFGRAVTDGAVLEATRLGLRAMRAMLPAAPIDAEMLLVVGRFADELAAARQLLPGQWRAAGFVGAGVEEVLADLGDRREGLLGPAQWLPVAAPCPDVGPSAAEFVAAYRRRAGADPPYPAAQAFAAGLVAAQCVREAGSADDTALLAAARLLRCTTMFGQFRLDPVKLDQVGHRVLTVQWQDGIRRIVAPAGRAQAPLRYPLAST